MLHTSIASRRKAEGEILTRIVDISRRFGQKCFGVSVLKLHIAEKAIIAPNYYYKAIIKDEFTEGFENSFEGFLNKF